MHKKRSSKFVIARRAALYTFMSTAVVVLVTVLVFIMLGYQFNRKDGRIEQGGLVQLGSRPSGAKISIDGNETSMTTSNKATLTRGKHTIEFSRDGSSKT